MNADNPLIPTAEEGAELLAEFWKLSYPVLFSPTECARLAWYLKGLLDEPHTIRETVPMAADLEDEEVRAKLQKMFETLGGDGMIHATDPDTNEEEATELVEGHDDLFAVMIYLNPNIPIEYLFERIRKIYAVSRGRHPRTESWIATDWADLEEDVSPTGEKDLVEPEEMTEYGPFMTPAYLRIVSNTLEGRALLERSDTPTEVLKWIAEVNLEDAERITREYKENTRYQTYR